MATIHVNGSPIAVPALSADGKPAAPWRRLAASVLDTGVLLLWNAAVFACAAAVAPDAAPEFPLAYIATASAAVYSAVGWAVWGMTFGKWMLGIRVVAADGSKLTWLRAVARVPAFVVASMPPKIGLAAMLWDHQRRGWHDRLAGTMVIPASASVAPRPGDAEGAEGAGPDRGAAPSAKRRKRPRSRLYDRGRIRAIGAAMLAVYIVVALALTMPLALHFSTHVPGAQVEGLEQEGYVSLWDYWWVKTALTHPGLEVMATQCLFWPQMVSLRHHTLVLLHSGAAALLQGALSLIQTYNLLLVLSLAACAWGAFLLCRHITDSVEAAAVGGLIFGFSPYLTTHALAQQNLIAAEWLAPFAYCTLRGLHERRTRYVLGAAASWALTGLCEWYYFLYAGMLLVILLACEVVRRPHRWAGTAGAALVIAVLTVSVSWPLLGPMLTERAQASYIQQPLALGTALGAQPGLYVTPAFTHPLFGGTGTRVLQRLGYSRGEETIYLGLVVIALALAGVAHRRWLLAPWAAGAVFFLLLALGPYLRIGERDEYNALTLLLLGGPPGNGFDLPTFASLSSDLAQRMVGGIGALGARTRIALPYLWLWKGVIIRLAPVPTRAVLPAMLCLAVLAAGGLAALTQGVRRRHRASIAVLAAALVLFEFMPVPYPLRRLHVPQFYRDLAQRPDTFALAEVPLTGDHAVYMYYQTVHHKPLLAGMVSGPPRNALAFVRGNGLLRQLEPLPQAPPGEPVLELTRGRISKCGSSELRTRCAAALASLENHRVGVIAAHPEELTEADAAALDRLLHNALGLRRQRYDGEIVAYFLPGVAE